MYQYMVHLTFIFQFYDVILKSSDEMQNIVAYDLGLDRFLRIWDKIEATFDRSRGEGILSRFFRSNLFSLCYFFRIFSVRRTVARNAALVYDPFFSVSAYRL